MVLPALRDDLPAAGEMALFDRTWYNRAGVEQVMGFCTAGGVCGVPGRSARVRAHAPASGVDPDQVLVLGQRRGAGARFQDRIEIPPKRWKFSPMDLESREAWVDYSEAKDAMFAHTDTPDRPWYVVEADDKKRPGSTPSPTCCR